MHQYLERDQSHGALIAWCLGAWAPRSPKQFTIKKENLGANVEGNFSLENAKASTASGANTHLKSKIE